jgi:LAO/AO transport system kinase
VENDGPGKEELVDKLYPQSGNSIVIGVTGPPGAGKSTLVDKLIKKERAQNKKVAVIAVDPSSPFSGGAILGDRLRMQKHSTDKGVFIRSMASRGHLGGVAGATSDAIKVFDAAGFDVIIIETIGVGQTEVEIIEISDIVLLVLVPGMGDEIQALKAGVMEIGDLFVINKKDHHGADKLKAEVEYVLNLKENSTSETHPVIMTNANLNEGVQLLYAEIYGYLNQIKNNNQFKKNRKQRIISEIKNILTGKIVEQFNQFVDISAEIDSWAEQVYNGDVQPYQLVNNKIQSFLKELKRDDIKN